MKKTPSFIRNLLEQKESTSCTLSFLPTVASSKVPAGQSRKCYSNIFNVPLRDLDSIYGTTVGNLVTPKGKTREGEATRPKRRLSRTQWFSGVLFATIQWTSGRQVGPGKETPNRRDRQQTGTGKGGYTYRVTGAALSQFH